MVSPRNALRKKVDGKWTNTVPAVECYTIDPGFIFRRNQPMLDARKLLAGPLGVKPAEIKFDKIARKLISPDGNTILATQSRSMLWRAAHPPSVGQHMQCLPAGLSGDPHR